MGGVVVDEGEEFISEADVDGLANLRPSYRTHALNDTVYVNTVYCAQCS